MISCLFITNSSGRILVLRIFRGDVTKDDALIFCRNVLSKNGNRSRNLLNNKETNYYLPTYRYEKLNFFYIKMEEFYMVALTRQNGNGMLVFHSLVELRKLILNFFTGIVAEEEILNNITVIYELLDEVFDGGYTQNMEELILTDIMSTKVVLKKNTHTLSNNIKLNGLKLGYLTKYGVDPENYTFENEDLFEGNLNESDNYLEYCKNVLTMMATSVIPPWRKVGTLYGRNMINVNLVERINLLYNYNSSLINYEINGSIVVNSQLSGTPIIYLRLNNDFATTNAQGSFSGGHNLGTGQGYNNYKENLYINRKDHKNELEIPIGSKKMITLNDCKFHQCVNLDSIRLNKTISFIPPDGMFVLLYYRTNNNFAIPFVVKPKIKKLDKLHVNYVVALTPTFSKHITSQRVEMRIPIPKNTKEVVVNTINNNTHIDTNLSQHYVNWIFKKLQGENTYLLNFTAILVLNKVVDNNLNVGPNAIQLQFVLPYFTSSGLYVASIDINNFKQKLSKTVNYTTKSGLYQHRIHFAE